MLPTDDLLPRIRDWVEVTGAVELPPVPTNDEFLRQATILIHRLRCTRVETLAGELETDAEAPDLLLAICELLDRPGNSRSNERDGDLALAYELVSRMSWVDAFGERDQILARLSFLAWDHWRKMGNYEVSQRWENCCVRHVRDQEHARQFLALEACQRSASLNRRFLGDEAVLLTLCVSLEGRRDAEPSAVAVEATLLYRWLLDDGTKSGIRAELTQFLAARVALSVAFAEYQLGRERNRNYWSGRAQAHAEKSLGAAPLKAMIEHARLVGAFGGRAFASVRARCPALIQRLDALQMHEKSLRVKLLRGRAMKELGESAEALVWMEKVEAEAVRDGDLVVAALALCDRAEILSSDGCFELAMTACRKAIEFAKRCDSGWVVANIQGTLGELLRNQGELSASVDAYSACVNSYDDLEMQTFAAYVRVILAETLLLAGLPGKAWATVLIALPVIERENLTQEAVAALGILREALRRQQPDPNVLRQLREQLQRMREEGRL